MNTNRKIKAEQWSKRLSEASAKEMLSWAEQTFPGKVALASSLGVEDQVLTHLIACNAPGIAIITLDTGRLFPETYDLLRQTERQYGIRIRIYCPDAGEVEEFVNRHGIDAYRESVELRKECCRIRKVHPLQRALKDREAWICGLRREQGVTRTDMRRVEWDEANGLFKINPLADWTDAEVWENIRRNAIPFHPLHNAGFPSIGCACCTRAIAPGEDLRAGRWWWENPEHKECGLHGKRASQ